MSEEFKWKENDNKFYAYYGKTLLGHIEFYPEWKKYVWEQYEDIIMSISCLKNVIKKT